MTSFGGWRMPVQYETGIVREHLATRRCGGLFDISHMGRFRVAGARAREFLQSVVTSNVAALAPGMAQYGFLATATGGVRDDVYVYCWEEGEYLLVVNAANCMGDWEHLFGKAGGAAEVVLEDLTERVGMVAVQGPLSGELLGGLMTEGGLTDTPHNSLSTGSVAGVTAGIGRTGYTGEPVGFEVFVGAESVERLWGALAEAGAALGVVPVGLGARDTLRLEACMPLYGHEMGEREGEGEVPAFALRLARVAVSFAEGKGNYDGKEALGRQARQAALFKEGRYEPNAVLSRVVRPLAVLSRSAARPGDAVYVGARRIGTVTSGTSVPYWTMEAQKSAAPWRPGEVWERRSLALALVDAESETGLDVEVEVRGRRLPARLVRRHGRSDAPPYFRPLPAIP